jgi:hypothetical protein
LASLASRAKPVRFYFHLDQAAKVYQGGTGHACYLKISGLSFVIGDSIGLGVNKECMVAI